MIVVAGARSAQPVVVPKSKARIVVRGEVISEIIKVSSKGRLSGLEERQHVPGQGGCGSFMSEHSEFGPGAVSGGSQLEAGFIGSILQGFNISILHS